jgi:hypothetical protein
MDIISFVLSPAARRRSTHPGNNGRELAVDVRDHFVGSAVDIEFEAGIKRAPGTYPVRWPH